MELRFGVVVIITVGKPLDPMMTPNNESWCLVMGLAMPAVNNTKHFVAQSGCFIPPGFLVLAEARRHTVRYAGFPRTGAVPSLPTGSRLQVNAPTAL